MHIFEAAKFLQCYKISGRGLPSGIVLLLLDSGSSCFISPCPHHFPIEIRCHTEINGIGNQKVSVMAPQVVSVLNARATRYITFGFARGYRLDSLGFGIISSGQLEAQGYQFRLQDHGPHFVTPDGDIGHLIKDYHTGFSWIAERTQAKPSVDGRSAIVRNMQGNEHVVRVNERVIGTAEMMPTTPWVVIR